MLVSDSSALEVLGPQWFEKVAQMTKLLWGIFNPLAATP